jgi:hypothetical protein
MPLVGQLPTLRMIGAVFEANRTCDYQAHTLV